jgi:hypothetical protein
MTSRCPSCRHLVESRLLQTSYDHVEIIRRYRKIEHYVATHTMVALLDGAAQMLVEGIIGMLAGDVLEALAQALRTVGMAGPAHSSPGRPSGCPPKPLRIIASRRAE